MEEHIIDGGNFNGLFENPVANRDAIFIALRELARRTAGTLNFPAVEDRDDAISDALLHAMHRVERYHPGRQRAAAYFFRMLRRHMVKMINAQKFTLHDRGADDNNWGNSIFDAPRRPLEQPHVSQYRRFETRLEEEPARERAKAVIDRALHRARKFLDDADTDQEQIGARAALDVLQEMRKQLLGRYNRLMADHVKFTDSRRVGRDD